MNRRAQVASARRRDRGVTLFELLIVVAMLGLLTGLAYPRIGAILNKTNLRASRVALSTAVATARASAAQRGCRAVVHFTSGASGVAWVTACPRLAPGAGTVDTIGAIEQIASRYQVTLTPTRDSIQYDPRGLSMDNLATTVLITHVGSSNTDSLQVNVLGKVVR